MLNEQDKELVRRLKGFAYNVAPLRAPAIELIERLDRRVEQLEATLDHVERVSKANGTR